MPPMKREDPCETCNLSTEEGMKAFKASMKKIDEIHFAVYGMKDQPETGIIHRLTMLEKFKRKIEDSVAVQIGVVIGSAIGGGGIGALVTQYIKFQ